ncbi:SAM-dependent methyltransferase [Treponema phagedenis]|uniref:class I SAM-dependent methyltransferase n=1 Tax=Treponema phagedenis TaxID=162 RepID=UPI0011E66875|nr:SAM-dependent methyltransferase [Treponema phagedenis]QEJ94185.1 SAM-dependent methyltransferase [Treponema phagedenis]QKS91531.1 SAM-dependent methyltransferase [Treponema phagedenis]
MKETLSAQEAADFCFAQDFYLIGFSKSKKNTDVIKMRIRRVFVKNEKVFQLESYTKTQVFHKTLTQESLLAELANAFTLFGAATVEANEFRFFFFSNKRGAIRYTKKARKESDALPLTHDKKPNYLLPDSEPIAFLIAQGIMSTDGKVVKKMYPKFRQINKFLEFIHNVLPAFDENQKISILDFGCGKAYLSFALYHYLHVELRRAVQLVGLDLKEPVIKNANALAKRLDFAGLEFFCGDIANYKTESAPDMVICLHACNTATDYALAKAVQYGAKVIMAVPCCQHELFAQIKQTPLPKENPAAPLFEHGIIAERSAALLTDTMRATLLKVAGYKVQVMEFIDTEHTPKNILIRAIKKDSRNAEYEKTVRESYSALKKFFGVEPLLETLLRDEQLL